MEEKFSNFWHPSKNRFCCEWWYFTFFLKNNGIISVCYAIEGGVQKGKVWISINLPQKKPIFIFERYENVEASEKEVYVDIGGNIIHEENGKYFLQFCNNKISLDIEGRDNKKLKDNILIKKAGLGVIKWIIPVLKGNFQGQLRIGDENYEIEGIMFHDHVLRDIRLKNKKFGGGK